MFPADVSENSGCHGRFSLNITFKINVLIETTFNLICLSSNELLKFHFIKETYYLIQQGVLSDTWPNLWLRTFSCVSPVFYFSVLGCQRFTADHEPLQRFSIIDVLCMQGDLTVFSTNSIDKITTDIKYWNQDIRPDSNSHRATVESTVTLGTSFRV